MEIIKVKYLGNVNWRFKGKNRTAGDIVEMTTNEYESISKVLKLEIVKETDAK